MNRISISKNLVKKMSKFFLVFFIFLSFFNSSKAQSANPSDLKLYSYQIASAGYGSPSQTLTNSFKGLISEYATTTQYASGSTGVRAGAYTANINNLRTEINSLVPQFDSSFSTIQKNSGNLGVNSYYTNTIIAAFLLKKLVGEEVDKITKLKAVATDSNEKDIESDLLKHMSSSLSYYTDKIDSTGTMSAYGYKYQMSPDGTKIINVTNIDANSGSGWFSNSYQDIVNKIISAINSQTDDTASQKNPDILDLKSTVTSSITTFNDTVKKIQASLNNSSGVAITADQQMYLAEKEVLSTIDNTVNNYINDTNNQKPGNEKVINAYKAAGKVIEDYLNTASSTISDAKINYNSTSGRISQSTASDCDSKGFFQTVFSSNSGCSVAAYLINSVIQLVNGLVNIVVSLVGSLFDWIYDTGVINFKSWVDGSGAYIIYKKIILSLLVSVMFFFVSYLILISLFNDDMEKMKKILPKLIITALFVYFSFTIAGWIIDQSNIITIYLYRSMTHQDGMAQTIGEVFKRILNIENGGANSGGSGISDNFGISLGSWNAIPFTLGQLALSIVGVFVLFEGAVLILSRTIILLLCMIFSPLMLLPEGLTDFTDKYRKLVIDNFTGNVLLGPVFMFLVLIAVQIGQITTKMVGNGPALDSSGANIPANFLGGIISSVLVIVVLQLAISASKSLSGSMGEKLSGVISKYAGGAAFGGGAAMLRNTVGRGAAIAKDKGWMMGKEGSRRHEFMTRLYNGAAKSTFDARNTDTFQKAANFSGAGAASFGQGSNKNYNDSFKAKLYNANKYHNGLDEGGKQRNIERLKRLGNSGDLDSKRIAESLEKKWKPSINERLNNDSDYNKKFDKAQNQKDENKRKEDTEKVVNEHFKENGLGSEHFTKEINKPENNKIKQEYEKALSEKDPIKRKETLTKVIADIDKKSNPDENSTPSLTQSLEQTRINNTESDRIQSEKRRDGLESMRTRAKEKYGRQTETKEEANKRTTLYKEKNNEEIKAEKEKNGGFVPSAQDLNAQTSLKNKLKAKWTPEKQDNFFAGVEKRAEEKAVQKSIERNENKQMDANVNYVNNLSSNNKGGNKGPELSNSTVSNEPPTISLDTGAGNKIEIPLTKEDGKPNIIQGDKNIFSQN